MRPRKIAPVFVWMFVFVISGAMVGGSLAYAARVGEPTVRDDAERYRQRMASRPPVMIYGNTSGQPGQPGQPGQWEPFTTGPGPQGGSGLTPAPGSPGGNSGIAGRPPSGANTTFNGLDMASTAPPEACIGPLLTLAGIDPLPVDLIEDAWREAADCASARGSITIPSLSSMTSDDRTRQCLGAYFIRATLAFRASATAAVGLDRFLGTCAESGLAPGPMPAQGQSPVPAAPQPTTAPVPSIAPAVRPGATALAVS